MAGTLMFKDCDDLFFYSISYI